MNTDGWKTIVTILVWAGYEIAANVVPDFQKMDRATIESTVNALANLAMPLVMLVLRLMTSGPVAPPIIATVEKIPVVNKVLPNDPSSPSP